MPPEIIPEGPYFRISLVGSDDTFLSLLDISGFLYDFNLLYEITRLATDPRYHDFRFSNYVLFRRGRPLQDQDRLYVETLTLSSPLVVVTDVAAVSTVVGALYGVLRIFEWVRDRPLNRRKLKAEVEKVERENRQAGRTVPDEDFEDAEQVRRVLRLREAETHYDNVAGRLRRSAVRVKEIKIEFVESLRRRNSE